MNPRERTLLSVLVAILGCGALGFAGYRFWLEPFFENRKAIAAMEKEVEQLDEQMSTFRRERKKLELARLKSLPAESHLANAQYIAYLQPLLAKEGLSRIEINPMKGVQKIPLVTPIDKIKEVGHQLLSFTVSCEGNIGQMVAALEQMQKTPYEHRIKMLTIGRLDQSVKKDASSKLTLRMSVEALLVAGTKNKSGLPSGLEAPPAPKDRDYADIASRNIFVGYVPPPPAPTPVKMEKMKEPQPPPPVVVKTVEEPEDYIPSFVYLTQVVPDQQTAYLRNRLYDKPTDKEMTLIAKKGSGYDTFRITGPETDLGKWIYFRAKVLKVELRKIYFQVGNGADTEKFQEEDGKRNFRKNEVYVLEIGQPISSARMYSSNRTRIEMQDEGLYNEAFEKEEAKLYREEQAAKEALDNKGKTQKMKFR